MLEFEASGYLVYDPPRPGMKRRTNGWCIINVDREITRYYRWVVQAEHGIKLCKPSWDAHISVVRGEFPPDPNARADLWEEHPELHEKWQAYPNLWKKYHGEKVTFSYGSNVRRSGDVPDVPRPDYYWFINVECPRVREIREEFGFPVNWRSHLTVGRTYPEAGNGNEPG